MRGASCSSSRCSSVTALPCLSPSCAKLRCSQLPSIVGGEQGCACFDVLLGVEDLKRLLSRKRDKREVGESIRCKDGRAKGAAACLMGGASDVSRLLELLSGVSIVFT